MYISGKLPLLLLVFNELDNKDSTAYAVSSNNSKVNSLAPSPITLFTLNDDKYFLSIENECPKIVTSN